VLGGTEVRIWIGLHGWHSPDRPRGHRLRGRKRGVSGHKAAEV
jgi:hypothetical protein